MENSGISLSDLLVSLSLATDLGFGQPPEHMARSARIGMRLGERLGLDAKDLDILYDVGILTYVGCPVYGNEPALLFGDDIDFRAHAIETDLAGFPAMVFMLRRAGHGTSAFNRARQAAAVMSSGGRQVVQQMADHCSAAGALATRLGLNEDVQAGIEQAYARWDGRGFPDDLSGTDLSLAARISHVAEACEVFQRTAGIEAALDVVRSRSGTHFDPEIANLVSTDPESLFEDLDQDTVDELLAAEPMERGPLTDDESRPGAGSDRRLLRPSVSLLRRTCPRHGGPGPWRRRGDADALSRRPSGLPCCARPRRRAVRRAGIGVGKARTVDGERAGAGAPARLLRRADLQPARSVAPYRPTGRHPPRADGRLRLSPRCRRDDAVVGGPGPGRRRRLQRNDAASSVPGTA